MRRLAAALLVAAAAACATLAPIWIISRKVEGLEARIVKELVKTMTVEEPNDPDERRTTIDCPAIDEEVEIVTKRRKVDGEWESDASLATRHKAGVQSMKDECAE